MPYVFPRNALGVSPGGGGRSKYAGVSSLTGLAFDVFTCDGLGVAEEAASPQAAYKCSRVSGNIQDLTFGGSPFVVKSAINSFISGFSPEK